MKAFRNCPPGNSLTVFLVSERTPIDYVVITIWVRYHWRPLPNEEVSAERKFAADLARLGVEVEGSERGGEADRQMAVLRHRVISKGSGTAVSWIMDHIGAVVEGGKAGERDGSVASVLRGTDVNGDGNCRATNRPWRRFFLLILDWIWAGRDEYCGT